MYEIKQLAHRRLQSLEWDSETLYRPGGKTEPEDAPARLLAERGYNKSLDNHVHVIATIESEYDEQQPTH